MHSRLLTLLFLCLLFTNCSQQSANESLSYKLDPIFKKAQTLVAQKEYDSAIQLIDSEYAKLNKPAKGDLIRKWAFIAEILYFEQQKFVETLHRIDSLLEITKEQPELYSEEYVDAMYMKGNILISQNEYLQGSYYFQKALEFTKQNFDVCQKSYFYGNLANLLLNQGRYKEAIKQLQNHFIENGQCDKTNFKNYFTSRQGALNNIGFAYEQMGSLDSAVTYYRHALNYTDSVGITFPEETKYINLARAVVEGNLGGVLVQQANYEEALKMLNKSIDHNSKFPNYALDVCLSRIKLATLYIRTLNWEEADKQIELLDTCLPNLTSDRYLHRYYKMRWEYADFLKDTGSAYEYHIQLKELSDKLNKKIQGEAQIDYQQVFRNFSQENELVLLRASNRQKTIYIFLFFVLVLMSGIIIFLVKRNQIQAKRNLSQLSRYNEVILNKTNQLQKTLFDLQESQEENTQMMKIVAHDLRNPISAIVQIAQLIQMDKAIAEEQLSLVNMIQNSARASLEFINDLLHLNTSFDNLKKEELDISSVLQNSIELLNFKATEKNQHLHLETEEAICMINREKLWRVFNNLISNSIKFSPDNSVIQISLKKSGQKAICIIMDKGIGIPEEIKHQIFDLFTEAKRSGTSGEQSFGLGLAISKQIIEAHQGSIWFESEENEGTTFYIELPLAKL